MLRSIKNQQLYEIDSNFINMLYNCKIFDQLYMKMYSLSMELETNHIFLLSSLCHVHFCNTLNLPNYSINKNANDTKELSHLSCKFKL
jgi:hypothetical protein